MSECMCGRPLKGDAICPGCAHALQVALGDISSHWVDLDTVKGRQTRYGGTGGRGGEKPLPVDARFLGWDADGTRLQDAVKNTMATWARVVLGERPVLEGPTHPACLHITCAQLNRSRPPRDDVVSVCRYLLGQADWVKAQHWAPEILDELTDVAGQLRRMVDRPAEKRYCGTCDYCDEPLHAYGSAEVVVCTPCDVHYIVKERRQLLWDQALQVNATAAEISRAMFVLNDTPLSDATIRKWVQRKRLTAVGTMVVRGREMPIYRVADVAALVESQDDQKAG